MAKKPKKPQEPKKIVDPGAPTPVSEANYNYATENYVGWCTECKDFTRECTEPDAEGYNCPSCTQNTVIGAEDALLNGLIVFKEDSTSDDSGGSGGSGHGVAGAPIEVEDRAGEVLEATTNGPRS